SEFLESEVKNEPPISGGGVRETDLIKAIREKELFKFRISLVINHIKLSDPKTKGIRRRRWSSLNPGLSELKEENQRTTFCHCTVIQVSNKIRGQLL
ncbi:hypothetical protein Gogos_014176, partial [Gossypium gossypioides]|nr:hypothetical protein [Gossypium gossypioides]